MARQKGRKRRVPQRTCIACRQVQGKRELIRIVRTPAGEVRVDPTGKLSGRGAYLCANRSCWQVALEQGRLRQALKTGLTADELQALADYGDALAEADDDVEGEQ